MYVGVRQSQKWVLAHINLFGLGMENLRNREPFDLLRPRQGKKWKLQVQYDKIPTLRTQNMYIFLLSTKDINAPDEKKTFFRYLDPVERLPLQGFPPTHALHFNRRDLVHATGNAYCAPMVAAALMPILCALQPSRDWPGKLLKPPQTSEEWKSLKAAVPIRGRSSRKTIGIKLIAKKPIKKQNKKSIGIKLFQKKQNIIPTQKKLKLKPATRLSTSASKLRG
jgi:hypothetical protein